MKNKDTKVASLTWEGQGLGFKVEGQSGYSMRLQNPSGPHGGNPMELVAMASGGCTAMDVIEILRKKRQHVTGFEVNVTGVRASQHPKVFKEIDIEYVVRGHHIDPKAVERSIELSLTKYCSVNIMLSASVKINSSYRIENVEAAPA